MNFQALTSFSEERILDLFSCGLEGGIGYWCTVNEVKGNGYYDFNNPEWSITFELIEEDNKKVVLNKFKLSKGLQIMSEKYPYHWNNFLTENEDAITGDVYVQCCLLNEIVYG